MTSMNLLPQVVQNGFLAY